MSLKTNILGVLQASLAILVLVVSTSLFFIPFFLVGIGKALPFSQQKRLCASLLDYLVLAWSKINILYIKKAYSVQWDIKNEVHLSKNHWYLVIANHQSWLDIVVLLQTFTHKIPTMRFFIKDELKWIPLLNFAWWILDCPFLKRYSKVYLQKHPEKKEQDKKAIQKAMALFTQRPVSVINFVEGTRFSLQKKAAQQSPYRTLLKPKAGGISYALQALEKKVTSILDVSIIYPSASPSLWAFLCHKIPKVTVILRELPLPHFLQSSAFTEEEKRTHLYQWLNEQWRSKDRMIQLENNACTNYNP